MLYMDQLLCKTNSNANDTLYTCLSSEPCHAEKKMLRRYRGNAHGQNELNENYFLVKLYYKSISGYCHSGASLKYRESNAMGSALNTWQMPRTSH